MLVTKSKFAEILGVDKANITRWAQEGRLVMDGKLVNVEESKRKLEETSSGTHRHVAERHAAYRAMKLAKSNQDSSSNGKNDEKIRHGADLSGADAHENNRVAIRKLRELMIREDRLIELGLLRKEMILRDELNAIWGGLGVSIRSSIEAMIERLSPRLSACRNKSEIESELAIAIADERKKVKRLLIHALKQAKQ